MERVKDLIIAAEKDPMTSNVDIPVANPESYTSFKHQLDLRLRKAVGKLAVTMKPKMKEIAWKRKELMQSIDDLAEEVCIDDLERILNEIVESFIWECSHFGVALKQITLLRILFYPVQFQLENRVIYNLHLTFPSFSYSFLF